MLELGIKHRYIRPRKPQTDGKVERFLRMLNEDVIEDIIFNSVNRFIQ